MKLKDFIKETLKEIAEGVVEAQNETKDTGAIINPSAFVTGPHGDKYFYHSGTRHVEDIEINVAVSVTEVDGERSGIGVVAGFITGGIGNTTESHNSTVSTIKLKIPVALPVVEVPTSHTSGNVF